MGTSRAAMGAARPMAEQPTADQDAPNRRALRKGFQPVFLDAANFLLSDVRGALLCISLF